MKSMRIAFLSFQFSDATNGGASTLIWELATRLTDKGHEVLVITCSDKVNKVEQIAKIKVIRLKMAFEADSWAQYLPRLPGAAFVWQQSLEFYRAAQEALAQFQPDIVEVPESYGLGLFWALERRYPLVVRCVCPSYLLFESGYLGDYPGEDIELVKALELLVIGAADARISICNDLVERISEDAGIPQSDFDVVRVPLRSGTDSQTHPVRNRSQDFPELFYFGRVEPQKGTEFLMAALPYVAKEYPNFRLTMAGSDTRELKDNVSHSEKLKLRLSEMGLSDRVSFTGHLSLDEIKKRVQEADICVFPSTYETACYTAIESMSYGGCVLATSVGGLPEYVKHSESGWLVPGKNPRAMAEAILLLSRDESLRARLRKSGPQMVRSLCDPDAVVDESLAIYRRANQRFYQEKISENSAFPVFASLVGKLLQSKTMIVRAAILDAKYKQGYVQGLQERADGVITSAYKKLRNPFASQRR